MFVAIDWALSFASWWRSFDLSSLLECVDEGIWAAVAEAWEELIIIIWLLIV